MQRRDGDENLRWEQEGGSPFQQLLGYRLTAWERDRAVVEMEVGPQHLNRAGLLHGGVIATLLDTTSGYAGCWCGIPGNARRAITLSLTTNFIGQARPGLVTVEGRKTGGGQRIFFTSAEARNRHGDVIATATGTFRYHSGSETEAGSPR